jgi:hypothetical protein
LPAADRTALERGPGLAFITSGSGLDATPVAAALDPVHRAHHHHHISMMCTPSRALCWPCRTTRLCISKNGSKIMGRPWQSGLALRAH